MKTIFKGNNFAIVWNIIDSSTHTPFDFSGMKVEVGLYSECCKKAIKTYNISNGTIEFEVESEELQNGVYNLMCRYSTENEQAYCIYKRAFQITGKPEFASNVETIILESKASHIDATDHDDPIPDFENCQLIAQELFKENFRLPQLTAHRAIADEHGNRIVDTYVSREAVTKHIRNTYNQQFLENPPLITEGYITPQMLSDETRQLLEESGATINNLPDGEDLQSVHGVLKLANKQHNPNSYSGLGRQYLRKNIVAGQNILTQSMLQWPNTIYIIQYDYDLNGETITIPAGCTLQYDGGSLSNGTIVGNNTAINAPLTKIFELDIELTGNWNVSEAYPEWFGAKGDGVTDCTKSIQKTNLFANTFLSKGIYKVTDTITVVNNIIGCRNNTTIKPYFDGDVFRITKAYINIECINIFGGNWNEDYSQPRIGTPGAAIVVGYEGTNAQNVRISDCHIYTFYGKGILYEQGSKLMLDNITINNVSDDGIYCTENYNDNNECTFLNTHVMNCAGVGYNIPWSSNVQEANASRCHHFVNAKGFGNRKNYFIGSIGNTGTLMSEKGKEYSEFGPRSKGNNIACYSTNVDYVSWVDNGLFNVLEGFDIWNIWRDKNRYIENLHINKRFSGYQVFTQSANNTFEDTIEAISEAAIVHHSKGDASSRTDKYQNVSAESFRGEFLQADGGWYSPFRQNGSNPNLGPKPLILKNKKEGANNFINGFIIAPESFNGNPAWGIGSMDDVPIFIFSNGRKTIEASSTSTKALVDGLFNHIQIINSSPSDKRPTVTFVGFQHFDTTLNKPIWWTGEKWVDATGTEV